MAKGHIALSPVPGPELCPRNSAGGTPSNPLASFPRSIGEACCLPPYCRKNCVPPTAFRADRGHPSHPIPLERQWEEFLCSIRQGGSRYQRELWHLPGQPIEFESSSSFFFLRIGVQWHT